MFRCLRSLSNLAWFASKTFFLDSLVISSILLSYNSACLRDWTRASLNSWFRSDNSWTAIDCCWLIISSWLLEKDAISDRLRYSIIEFWKSVCISWPSVNNRLAISVVKTLVWWSCCSLASVLPNSPWRWCTSSLYSSWISIPRWWIRLAPCSIRAPRRSRSWMRIVAPSSSRDATISSAWYSATSFVEHDNLWLSALTSSNTFWLCSWYSVNLISMSWINWSLDAAYASILLKWLRREVSVDLLLTRVSPVLSPIRSCPALVDLSLGVVRPRVGRCPWRTTSLRALFREDLGILWVDILRLFDVTCHPDCVVRVERIPPLSAVSPGEDWVTSSTGIAAFSLKVNCVLRESPLPPCIFAMMSWLVLCVHNLVLWRPGYQHAGTPLPTGEVSPYGW